VSLEISGKFYNKKFKENPFAILTCGGENRPVVADFNCELH